MRPSYPFLLYFVLFAEMLAAFAVVRGLRPVGWFDAVIGITLIAIMWTFTYLKWPKR